MFFAADLAVTPLTAAMVVAMTVAASAATAGNRIRRTHSATFRSVSGLVVAVFMVSVFAGPATTADRSAAPSVGPGLLAVSTLIQYLEPSSDAPDPAETDAECARLAAIPGVTGVVTVYRHDSGDGPDVGRLLLLADAANGLGLGAVPSAAVVSVNSDVLTGAPAVFTPAEATDVAKLTPSILLLGTDGSTAALERARTALQSRTIFTSGGVPAGTRTDLADDQLQSMAASYATLTYAVAASRLGKTTNLAAIRYE